MELSWDEKAAVCAGVALLLRKMMEDFETATLAAPLSGEEQVKRIHQMTQVAGLWEQLSQCSAVIVREDDLA